VEQKPDNRTKALTFTVLLHVILGAILILGIEFSDYRPLSGPKVDIIEAEIVPFAPSKPRPPVVDPEIERRKLAQEEEKKRQQQAETEARQREAEAARVKEETIARQKSEAEKQRQAEQALIKKAEAERKLAEDKKAQEAKAAAEAKRKAEQEEQRKAELAAKKKAEEALKQKKIEEEARRKAEADQQRREQELQEALQQEQRERELNPQKDAYSAAISRKIAENWLKPPGISSDLKCVVLVNQLPDGSVTGASITKSSGNATFDDSVIKAVYKAAPLPLAPTPEVFHRELEVAFCSTGNLC
jgi:colicin import membrane protein